MLGPPPGLVCYWAGPIFSQVYVYLGIILFFSSCFAEEGIVHLPSGTFHFTELRARTRPATGSMAAADPAAAASFRRAVGPYPLRLPLPRAPPPGRLRVSSTVVALHKRNPKRLKYAAERQFKVLSASSASSSFLFPRSHARLSRAFCLSGADFYARHEERGRRDAAGEGGALRRGLLEAGPGYRTHQSRRRRGDPY